MSVQNPPDFSKILNPSAFQVQGQQQFQSTADSISQQTGGINYDWSQVDAAVQALSGVGQYFDNAARTGQGLTAGAETRMGQQDLGAAPQTAADLGKALMRLGSQGAQQASAVGAAQANQAMQFEQQAAAVRQTIAQQRMRQMQDQMQLQDQKFQINRAVSQSMQGLNLAQLQLKNMYNKAVANAKNTQELDQIAADQTNLNQLMQYLGMGLGAASTVTAGIAGSMGTETGSDLPSAKAYANTVANNFGNTGGSAYAVGIGAYSGATGVNGITTDMGTPNGDIG